MFHAGRKRTKLPVSLLELGSIKLNLCVTQLLNELFVNMKLDSIIN
jgi:hypothetical protein